MDAEKDPVLKNANISQFVICNEKYTQALRKFNEQRHNRMLLTQEAEEEDPIPRTRNLPRSSSQQMHHPHYQSQQQQQLKQLQTKTNGSERVQTETCLTSPKSMDKQQNYLLQQQQLQQQQQNQQQKQQQQLVTEQKQQKLIQDKSLLPQQQQQQQNQNLQKQKPISSSFGGDFRSSTTSILTQPNFQQQQQVKAQQIQIGSNNSSNSNRNIMLGSSSRNSTNLLISPRSTPKNISDCCFALSLAQRCIKDVTPLLSRAQYADTLQVLDLSGNKLQEAPVQINNLHRLRVLKLDNNLIKSLPDELFLLTKLEQFSIANNLLLSFGLNNSNNNYSGSNNYAKMLNNNNNNTDLNNNNDNQLNKKVEDGPALLNWSDCLTSLNISRNHIQQIPDVISQMRELRNLNIAANDFPSLPCSMIQLAPKLQEFVFDWFKYCSPPLSEVCTVHNESNGAIMQELFSVMQQKQASAIQNINQQIYFKDFIEHFSGGICNFNQIIEPPQTMQTVNQQQQQQKENLLQQQQVAASLQKNLGKGLINSLFPNQKQNTQQQQSQQEQNQQQQQLQTAVVINQSNNNNQQQQQVTTTLHNNTNISVNNSSNRLFKTSSPNHYPMHQQYSQQQQQQQGRTLMHNAVLSEDISALRSLLQHAFPLSRAEDSDGHTPLSLAILEEKYYCAKILIHYKVDVNRGGGLFGSCLTMGVTKFQYYLVRDLLEQGADACRATREGNTPLHFLFSVWQKDAQEAERIAILLLEHGADPNALNTDQRAPLHLAARKGNFDAVKFAIEYNRKCYFSKQQGFRIEMRGGPDKQTILHIAAANQFADIVRLLLENKFDVFAKNADGRTPVSLSYRNQPLAKLIRLHEWESINAKILKNLKTFDEVYSNNLEKEDDLNNNNNHNLNYLQQKKKKSQQSNVITNNTNNNYNDIQDQDKQQQNNNKKNNPNNNISEISSSQIMDENDENFNLDMSLSDHPRLKNINDWNNLVPKLIMNRDEPRPNSLGGTVASNTDANIQQLPSTSGPNSAFQKKVGQNQQQQLQSNGKLISGNNRQHFLSSGISSYRNNPLTIENFNDACSESEIEQSFLEVEEGYQDRPNFIVQQKFIPYSPNNLQKIQSLNTLMTKCLSPKSSAFNLKQSCTTETISLADNNNNYNSNNENINSNYEQLQMEQYTKSLTQNSKNASFNNTVSFQSPAHRVIPTSPAINSSSQNSKFQLQQQNQQQTFSNRTQQNRQSMPAFPSGNNNTNKQLMSGSICSPQQKQQQLYQQQQQQQISSFQPNNMYQLLKKYKFTIREAENIKNYKQIIVNPNCQLSMRVHFMNQLHNIYNQVYSILVEIQKQTVYQQMIRDSMVEEYMKLGDDNINTLIGTNKQLRDSIAEVYRFLNSKNSYENTVLSELLINNLLLSSVDFQKLCNLNNNNNNQIIQVNPKSQLGNISNSTTAYPNNVMVNHNNTNKGSSINSSSNTNTEGGCLITAFTQMHQFWSLRQIQRNFVCSDDIQKSQNYQFGLNNSNILTDKDIEKLVPLENEYDNNNEDLNTIWTSYQKKNQKQRNNPLTNFNQSPLNQINY